MLSAISSNAPDRKMKEELLDLFVDVPTELIDECISICRLYQLTPEKFFSKWEAYVLNHQVDNDEDLKLDFNHLEKLKKIILKDQEKQNAAFSAPISRNSQKGRPTLVAKKENYSGSMVSYNKDNLNTLFKNDFPSTPRTSTQLRTLHTPAQTTPFSVGNSPFAPLESSTPTSSRFSERLNRLKVEEVFNKEIEVSRTEPTHTRCTVMMAQNQQLKKYRYMFDKIMERSEILDEQLDNFVELFQEHNLIDEPYRPDQPSQSVIQTVGRIAVDCNESGDFASKKLDPNSISLDVYRKLNGVRVKVQLDPAIDEFALFPGQVVGVEGVNNTGDYLKVTKFIDLPIPSTPTSTPAEVLEYSHGEQYQSGEPLSVIVTSGPYTLDDSLQYEPLKELVSVVEREKPDVFIMMGPFIDARHPVIQSGYVHSTFQEIFKSQVSSQLKTMSSKSPHTQIILVPSVHDAISEYVVFPQPPLFDKKEREELGIPKSVICAPNPVQFHINELLFAISTNDILFHLGAQELAKNSKTSTQKPDRMARLAKHVLQQRSFYPLFPPALEEGNIDLGKAQQYQLLTSPDVLIISSNLKYFAKSVETTLVINPGPLAKRQNGGTLAKLYVAPSNKEELEKLTANNNMDVDGTLDQEELMIDHQAAARSRVEIVRI